MLLDGSATARDIDYGGGYESLDRTSMADPHVCGAVGLLMAFG